MSFGEYLIVLCYNVEYLRCSQNDYASLNAYSYKMKHHSNRDDTVKSINDTMVLIHQTYLLILEVVCALPSCRYKSTVVDCLIKPLQPRRINV